MFESKNHEITPKEGQDIFDLYTDIMATVSGSKISTDLIPTAIVAACASLISLSIEHHHRVKPHKTKTQDLLCSVELWVEINNALSEAAKGHLVHLAMGNASTQKNLSDNIRHLLEQKSKSRIALRETNEPVESSQNADSSKNS